jgi:hypothetical protein
MGTGTDNDDITTERGCDTGPVGKKPKRRPWDEGCDSVGGVRPVLPGSSDSYTGLSEEARPDG